MRKLIYITLTLLLAACSSQQTTTSDTNISNPNLVNSSSGYTLRNGNLYDAQNQLVPKIFYFALDSNKVSDRDRSNLAAHAKFIKAEPQVVVKVEGHGDERGSREYNLSLGERRAYSVANVLRQKGVAGSRITSYGEERPASSGSNETSWKQNRRVEIIY